MLFEQIYIYLLSFHKLGWLRLDERNKPFVQAGEVFIDKIHHARAEDCATQRYRSVLDASYYINSDNNVNLFLILWIRDNFN